MTVREMLEAHPWTSGDSGAVVRCVEACIECSASCTSCADADLGEPDVQEMLRCVRLCLDCADVCATTSRVVLRQTATDVSLVRATVEACLAACRVCRAECVRHAQHHEHCRICAEVCGRCEQACQDLLGTIG